MADRRPETHPNRSTQMQPDATPATPQKMNGARMAVVGIADLGTGVTVVTFARMFPRSLQVGEWERVLVDILYRTPAPSELSLMSEWEVDLANMKPIRPVDRDTNSV